MALTIDRDLERLLASDTFSRAPRLRDLLAFLLLRQLEGKAAELKESVIGTEFFGRAPGYDSKKDPIVRVEAHRLRHRLYRYYNNEGADDESRIEVPRGTYVPEITAAPASRERWRIAVHVEADDTLTREGLTAELIGKVGALEGVSVVAARSSIAMPLSSFSSGSASALGINALLECFFDGVNLRARLCRCSAPGLSEIGSFDNAIQPALDALASFVASSLRRSRAPAPVRQRHGRGRVIDRESYQLFLSGRAWFHRWSPDNLAQAATLFEEVIVRCPDFAPAYASLADCQVLLAYWHTTDTRAALERGKAFSLKALKLDPACAEAYCSLGAFKAALDRDWVGAEGDFLQALEANPNNTLAMNWLSIIGMVPQGRFEDALDAVFSAFDLDPASPEISNEVVWVRICCRQFRAAAEHGRRIVELHPNFLESYWALALAEAAIDNYESARGALEIASRLVPGVSFTTAIRGFIEGRAGNRSVAEECLGSLQVLNETCRVRDLFFAWVYIGLGESARGVEYMQRAIDAADPHALYLNVFFVYDSLREHGEFAGLLRQMRLDQ